MCAWHQLQKIFVMGKEMSHHQCSFPKCSEWSLVTGRVLQTSSMATPNIFLPRHMKKLLFQSFTDNKMLGPGDAQVIYDQVKAQSNEQVVHSQSETWTAAPQGNPLRNLGRDRAGMMENAASLNMKKFSFRHAVGRARQEPISLQKILHSPLCQALKLVRREQRQLCNGILAEDVG